MRAGLGAFPSPMVVNASFDPNEEFYRRTIDVEPNLDVTIDLWLLDLIISGNSFVNFRNMIYLFPGNESFISGK